MPYQFDPYQDRFAGSIAATLARGGDIGAQRALTIGNAQANGAMASGNAWGNAIGGIGQSVGQAIAGISVARRAALQDELLKGRIADEQQVRAGGASVDSMMRGDQLPAGDAGPRQESYLGPDGLYDIPKMTAALGQSGMGHLAPELLKGAESLNSSILQHRELAAKTAQAHAVALGDAASGVLKLTKIGMPIDGAMDFVSQPLLASKTIAPEEYAQIRQQILSLPPDQQEQALAQLMDRAAQLSPTTNVGEGVTQLDRYKRTTATGGEKPPTTASLAAKAAAGDKTAAAAIALLHPDKPDTAAQDDQKYEGIVQKQTLKQPVTPDEVAFAKAYEQRKTLGVDKSAAAAAARQGRAIEAQTNQQARAQNFQEAQAGRKELTDKVEAPYSKAVEKVQTLREVVNAAQHGNMSAAAVQSLMGVLGVVTIEGVQRINTTELRAFGAAGSLLERLQGKLGQIVSGQPMAPKLQEDLKELATTLLKGSRTQYESRFNEITKRYGLKDERSKPPMDAPDEGTPRTVNGETRTWGYYDGQWGWKK